ncbi:MAG: hypothetical protein U0R65_12160 [Candidatus Nanopelagicales bacterium]
MVRELECLPLERRRRAERRPDASVVCVQLDHLGDDVVLGLAVLGTPGHRTLTFDLLLSHAVDGPAVDDRQDPRPGRRPAAVVPAGLGPDLLERLLQRVLREVLVAQDAQRQSVGARAEPPVEVDEGAAVALGAALQQVLGARRGRVGLGGGRRGGMGGHGRWIDPQEAESSDIMASGDSFIMVSDGSSDIMVSDGSSDIMVSDGSSDIMVSDGSGDIMADSCIEPAGSGVSLLLEQAVRASAASVAVVRASPVLTSRIGSPVVVVGRLGKVPTTSLRGATPGGLVRRHGDQPKVKV